MTLTIEVLYPEVANLHGDLANVTYLEHCRPDAEVIRTSLSDVPAFTTRPVDLVTLGALPERGQRLAADRLAPYRDRILGRIDEGGAFLFTHNAFEVLGQRLRNELLGYDVSGAGVLDIESTAHMLDRFNGKVMGRLAGEPAPDDASPDEPIVGYKSQFTMVEASDELGAFLEVDRGIGRNERSSFEGVRVGNFFGTSLIGPLLIANPQFTRRLLLMLDPDTEPVLAHAALADAAYRARLADFRDPARWHRVRHLGADVEG